jgi:thiamine pyrophosphokinase
MLVENGFQCLVLSPSGRASWSLGEAGRGKTFSLVPLAESVVSERNMYWELDHERLPALDDRGISNRVTTGFAEVEVHEGLAAGFLFW